MKADFDSAAPEERRILLVASDGEVPRARCGAGSHDVARPRRSPPRGWHPRPRRGRGERLSEQGPRRHVHQGLLRAPEGDRPRDLKGLVTSAITRRDPPPARNLEAIAVSADFGDPEDGAAYLANPIARGLDYT